MDPKLAFWTAALVNLFAIVVLVITGIVSVRRGRIAIHRRCMKTSAWLVVAFVAAYALKLTFMGREQLSLWSAEAVWNLRFHETCVAAMLIGGSIALIQSRRLRATRNVTRSTEDPPAPHTVTRRHRRAGWTAALGAGLGFASAIFVWFGMLERSQ